MCEGWQIYTQFYSEYLLEDLDIDGGDYIKMYVKETRCGLVGWIHLPESRAQ